MREGNQVWGKMEGIKLTTAKSRELLQQIQQRRKEVQQTKATQANNPGTQTENYTTGWNQAENQTNKSDRESLEAKFQQWELDEELKEMKRNTK